VLGVCLYWMVPGPYPFGISVLCCLRTVDVCHISSLKWMGDGRAWGRVGVQWTHYTYSVYY